MKTQERFLADQLLAILHGCPGPLTTAQITSAAPPLLEIYTGCDPTWHVRSRSSGYDSLSWPHHDGLGWLHLVGVSGGVTV